MSVIDLAQRRLLREMKMELRLAHPFRLKSGDNIRFLEQDEVDQVNKYVLAAVEKTPPSADQKPVFVKEQREAAIAELELNFQARVGASVLRTAVELRYRKDNTLAIPRKAEGKTQPGKWWGEIVEQLDAYPEVLEVSAQVAQWLVAVWQDEKVQNGFEPSVQTWVNLMDDEFERIAQLLADAKAEVKKA